MPNATCACDRGFAGEDCLQRTACPAGCEAHGVCATDLSCVCHPGWRGEWCQFADCAHEKHYTNYTTMVTQCDLPFRLLTRRYGARPVYSEMRRLRSPLKRTSNSALTRDAHDGRSEAEETRIAGRPHKRTSLGRDDQQA